MADPWGPGVKRDSESVDSYIKSFEALGAEKFKISAIRDRRGPVFMQEQLQYIVQAMDGVGNLHFIVNTSGKVTVVEDSAVSALARLTSIRTPMFTPPFADPSLLVSSDAYRAALYPQQFSVPLTEAAGAIAATTIVPAKASYTGHAAVQGIWAPAGTTDAANVWTFTVAAGTILGPDVLNMNITAERYHNILAGAAGIYAPPLIIRGTVGAGADDNKAIQVSVAGLAAVGIDYYIDGVYWYETI